MNPDLVDRVRRIAADVFKLSLAEVTLEASPETIADWDSVQHLNLVLALEQELGVEFSPEEIERMNSLGAILAVLEPKVRG